MYVILSDPLTLAVLALLIGQSLIFLVMGVSKQRQLRRNMLSESARAQTRLNLVTWSVLPSTQNPKSPTACALVAGWLNITAWGRIGMGVGILLAGGGMLGVLALLRANSLLDPLTQPVIQTVALLLQGYAVGMVAGMVLGLLIGTSRARPASSQAATPARPREYRVVQVAILPGVLLVIDVLLVGGSNLLFLPHFTQVQFWNLAIFPGLLLLVCALGEWFARSLAKLPLRLTDDSALAARAENRLRSWLVGMLLEREVFALFILVASQWLLQSFSQAQPGNLIYIAVLPIYAVVLLSTRGLLERAQQDLNKPKTS